ncbi:hypothetical protein BPNPMPFG_004327 [Mesorhizobium sp. AR07]|uniref:inverse autotransporter beta domain-containing protein n=1 Tax=Mesorhizobium sp. AR07 TaxID=2865838 RepID=UPI00215ECFFD|nr:inverse autotransporter beta domain-containing protein [Mesorhizobium sp. AR07]UVK42629.1 hypothetical protein BPNPMPFG_004327 [Mesorhizobium sp. AR07]
MGKTEGTRLGGGTMARGEDFRVRAGYRRSQIARQLWKTTALTTLALGLSGMAAHADPNGLWQPQVRAIIGADNNGGNAALEGFIPLKQTAESVLFLDVRAKHDFKDGFGQDVGLGIRRIVNPDLMIGGYAYLNVENFNSNQFTSATLGAEAITPHFDAHVNVYLPIKGDYSDRSTSSTLSMVGNQLLEQVSVLDHRQYAAWGIEGEVGAQVPINLPDKHSLRVDIGAYHFEDPHGDDHSVTGAKAGFEYTIGDVFGSNTSLVFAGEVRDDNRDHTQFAGSVRLNIPFNPGHGSDNADNGADGGPEPVYPVSEGLRKRVNERVRGDVGVRIQSQDVSGGSTTRVAINAATNAAFGKFYFTDGHNNPLGTGALGDPTTLDNAVTSAGAKGFIVALGGSGNITTGGVTLANGQTIIGGGGSVTARLFNGSTGTFNLGGSNGTIQDTNPANNVITLGNGNTLSGITITGGADGIFGNNITGATLTNVTVTGAGGNGADFTGTSTGITGSNFTSTGNGLDGLHIEGDGTYNFTGTTLLQGNGDDGLDATGHGTYTFATLNAKDNADRGITVQGTSTSGSFTTTGGTVSGNGGTAVFIDPITAHVVLDSITQAGGTSGVVLDHVSGSFTVNGATTISNTSGPAIAISDSPAAIRFGDIAISAPVGDGISFAGVNAAVVAGNIVISGLGVGTGLDFSGSQTNFTAQSLNITGTGAAGSIGIDLSAPSAGGATIVITNGGAIAGVDTGVRFGVAGSLANSANAAFTFGGGSIAGISASLDARGLNQTLGHYAFGATTFTGPQLFDTQNVIFVGASATGSGNGSSLLDLASIATADANTAADAIFVLVNRGTAIDAAGGFSLSAGQTLASFGNGRTFSLGGIPVNVTGDNISHTSAISDAGGAATLTDSGSGDVVTLANNSSLLDFNIAGGSANGVHGSGVSNVTISGLSVAGAGLDGLLFDGTNSVTASNLNSSNNGGAGLSIQGGGTYNFTGTTTLSNNTGNGLLINGNGTYGFGTLNATGNGGNGVSATSTGAGKLSTTGGTISGDGTSAFSATNIQLGVTLASLSQTGGTTGISLSGVSGTFTVSGATTIANTTADGLSISASAATEHFGGTVTITSPGGNGIALNGNSGAVTFGDVSIGQPGLNGIDVSGINGTIGFGNIDITGLPTGRTGLDLSGSRSTFTATSLDIAGAGSSTGIDLSGTTGGSVTIGTGTISAGTGVQMGSNGAAATSANTAFSFGAAGGASITGTTASLDMRGLNPGSGTYAFNGTVLNGPQLYDVANVIYVGATSTGLGDGSSANNLINAAAADKLTTAASTIFVLVKTASVQTTDTDADGFTLANGQSIVSFANGGTVTLGAPPANVTGTNIVTGTTQADPFGFGGATLSNTAGNTVDLANGNLVKNLTVSSSGFAIDGTGSSGATIGGVTISAATVGLLLDSTTGIVNVNNLTIQSASQTGIALVDSSATVNFTGNTKITGAANVALLANNFDGTATFDDLDITGASLGVSVVTGSSGTFTFGAGSSIANTGSSAFSIANSSANVTYNGTINQTSQASAVRVSFLNGGSATFGGAITASTGAATAINLTNNTGSTISFNGGLNLTTTTGIGFNASGGGTVNVAAAGTESITTGTGQAINLDGVTIGSGGVSFDSISTGVTTNTALNFNIVSGGTFSAGDVRVNGTAAGIGGLAINASSANFAIANLVTTAVDGTDVSLTGNTGTIGIGGTVDNSGTGNGVVISGGNAAITISADISSSANDPGTAVIIDGITGGSVTFTGNVNSTGTGNLFEIGTNAAPTGGTITFSNSALSATGGGSAIVNGLGAAATLNVNEPLYVTDGIFGGLLLSNIAGHATFGGNVIIEGSSPTIVELTNTSGTVAFNGSTLVNASGGSAILFSGTTSGTVSFADLDIALSADNTTGISFANAVVNGTITARGFDLTSDSSTGTTAVNLSNTTGTGTIQLGDPGNPATGVSSTIGGSGNGPGIGFQFSSTTAVNFIYGDGEGVADKLSTIKAVDILNSTGGFPTAGTYNFKDVDGAHGGFIGDISEAQGSTIYYVDQNGTGDGTADNPGSIAGAEASGAKIIALIDTSVNGTSNLINMMLAQQTGAGNKTLNLADGQILIGLKAGDSIDTAPYGGVGGVLGGNFKFSNINSSSIIDAPAGVDSVLPTLTTASGNTVDFTGRASIDNVIISNTGTGIGVSGTAITEVVLNRATIAGGGGGALSLVDGVANSEVALSNLVLSATGGAIASVNGTAGTGTLKVSAFSDITLLGNKGEVGGFSLQTVVFDANAATPGIDQVDGGTFIAGTSTNRVGGYGLVLGAAAGDLKFDTTNVAVKTATNSTFDPGGTATAVGLYVSGAANSSVDFGTATLNIDGTGALASRSDALLAQIGTGNRAGFSGVVTVNTVQAEGLHSDFLGTLFFGAAGNTVTTTGQPAISFANTRIENGSGGSAQFGAINSSGGGQNGIYLSNMATSPTLLFNGKVTIDGTTSNAIQIQNGSLVATSVTFAGAVSITNATGGGVIWQRAAGSTDTLTFSGGLSIQNSGGTGFSADRGAVALTGVNNVTTTNGTGVSISNASVSGGFTSVSASFAAGSGINLQNLTGTLDLGTGTLTNTGAGAAFNVGSATNLSGGNAVISYGGTIASNGTGAAVSIQELTGGSVTLSGNLTDGNATAGGNIVVASIDNGTAATVTFSGSSKQIKSGATDAVSLTGNPDGKIDFSGGGLDITTTTGAGFVALTVGNGLGIGNGSLTVTGTSNTIASGGDGLLAAVTNIGAGGIAFDSITSVATGGGGGVVLNSVDLAGNVNIGGLTNTGAMGVTVFGVTNAVGKSVNFTGTTNIDVTGIGLNFSGQLGTVNIANVAGSSLTIDGGSTGISFNGVMGGSVNIGGNTGSASIGATTSTIDRAIALDGNTGGTLNYNGSINVSGGSAFAGSVVGVTFSDLATLNLGGSVTSTTTSTAFDFAGADGTYTISSTIAHSGGAGVAVDGFSDGTITFSGTSKTFSTFANNGVFKAAGIGTGTLSFTGGGLGITTTSGAGFTASTFGAGTVSITGLNNTIATTTGTALKLDGATIGAGGLNFSSVSVNGAATGIALNNVGGGGVINLGVVDLLGITSRGVDISGTLGTSLSAVRLNIGLGAQNAIGLDLNGAALGTSLISASDFDVAGGGFAGTLGIDMAGTTGVGTIQLGDLVNNNPGPGGQTSTISNVAQGVQFSSTTNAQLVFGDGQAPAESSIATFGGGQVIHATDSLPTNGSYNFNDVNFTGDTSNLQAIRVYYIDAVGTGDGSFANPGSVANAELSTANVFVLIDKNVDTNQATINIGNSSLDLKDGQAVISFKSGDSGIDVAQLGVGGGLGAPASFHFTTIQASTVVSNPGGLDNSRPILASNGAGATINLPTTGTGTITAGVQNVTAINSGSGAGIFVNAGLASSFVLRNNDITAGGAALSLGTTGGTVDMLQLGIDGNIFQRTSAGVAVSLSGQNLSSTTNSILVNSFAGNTVTGNGTGGGILFSNVNFGNAAGGTLTVGTPSTPSTRVQGDGLSFINPTGTLNFTTLDIANNNGTGLVVNTKGAGTTFALNNTGGVVDTTAGTAFNLDPLAVNMTFASVTASGGASGIIFDGVAGTFTVTGATTITGTSAFGIDAINTNTGTFNFNTMTIDNHLTTGGGIRVATGTLNVTGLANIDTAAGIGLSQSGGTTSFVNGLTIDTTSGTGIVGTGGTMGITASAAAETVNSTGGQAINLSGVAATIALDTTSSGGGTNNVSLTNVTGTVGLGSGALSGATGASFNVVGGTATVTYAGNITQANNAALVSVSSGNTGSLTFNTGNLLATNGTGLQFDNADGSYNFNTVNGATTLTGGDAGIDILNGSGGTFSFGPGVSITSPSGTAFNVVGGTAAVTYSGNITQGTPGQAMVSISGGHATGTITFQAGILFAGSGTGLQFDNADGIYNFNGTTMLNGGDAGIDILNGSGGTFSFGTGTSITSPTGTAFNVVGGTASVTYSGNIAQANNAALVSVSGGHATGTITFQTGTLSATNGTGLQFDNADGTYNFNGTTTLNGGDAGVDILNGSGGTFTFGSNASITNPTGVGFLVAGGTSNVTYNGTISKTLAAGKIVDISGVTGGTITLAGNLTATGGFDNGIFVHANTGGTFNFNGGTKTLTTGAFTAVNLVTNTGATINFTNGGLAINTTSGIGFNATGGGTVNVTGSGNTVQTTAGGQILNWNGVAIGGSGVTFATLQSTASITGLDAINLTGVSGGTFNGGALSVAGTTTSGDGIEINGSSAAFNFTSATIAATADNGIFLSGANGAVTFSTVTINDTGQAGMRIDNNTNAVNVNGGSIGATNDPTGVGVDINGGSGNVTIAATVTKTTATSPVNNVVQVSGRTGGTVTFSGTLSAGTSLNNGIDVSNNTSGTITFSGANSTLSTGTFTAVNLTNNGTATVNFTGGGLAINTTSGTGFNATGGGTVTVQGTGNTITSTTGTALDVENTSIGGGNLVFQSISSNGGSANGIILVNTGTAAGNGGLHVTGNGANVGATGGGVIANKTGADGSTTQGTGIFLNGTKDVQLNGLQLNDFGNFAIRGNNVTGFTLDHSVINGNNGTSNSFADALAAFANVGEDAIRLTNLLGSGAITNSNISGGYTNTIMVENNTGTLNRLTIDHSTIGGRTNNGTGMNDAINFQADAGSTAMNLTVSNSTLTTARAAILAATGAAGTHQDIKFDNNTVTNNHPLIVAGGGLGVDIASLGNVTFDISNNTFDMHAAQGGTGIKTSVIEVNKGSGSGNSTFDGTISGNTIGVAGVAHSGSGLGSNDIDINSQDAGTFTIAILNNTLTHYDTAGIQITQGPGTSTINATVQGNITSNGDANAFTGLYVVAGVGLAGDNGVINLLVGGSGAQRNDFSNGDPADGSDVFLQQSSPGTSTFNLSRGGSGAPTAEQVVTDDNLNPATTTVVTSGTINLVNTVPPLP